MGGVFRGLPHSAQTIPAVFPRLLWFHQRCAFHTSGPQPPKSPKNSSDRILGAASFPMQIFNPEIFHPTPNTAAFPALGKETQAAVVLPGSCRIFGRCSLDSLVVLLYQGQPGLDVPTVPRMAVPAADGARWRILIAVAQESDFSKFWGCRLLLRSL